jgi:hypothetical protein
MQFHATSVRRGVSSNKRRASGREPHLAYMFISEVRTNASRETAAPARSARAWMERPRWGRRSAAQDLAREGKVEASPRRPPARRAA